MGRPWGYLVADRYTSIFTEFPHAIFIENSEGEILDANAAAAADLNVSLDELIGQDTADFLSPSSLEQLSSQIKALEIDDWLQLEVQFVPVGKTPITRLLDIFPVRWAGEKGAGSADAFMMVAREVDARDQLRRELLVYRSQTEKDAAGNIQAAFFITSNDSATRYPASETKRPLDWAGELIVGPPLRPALDQAWAGKDVLLKPAWYSSRTTGAASSSQALAAAAEQARSSVESEARQYWLEIAFSPLRGKGSSVAGICALVRDRTAERIGAEQLRIAEDQAVLALLSSSLRHELNNYLSVIIAQASALRMSLAPGQLPPPNVGAILDASQEAVALLRRSSEAGRGDALSPVRLNDVVADAVQLLRHMVPDGVRVSCDLALDIPLIRGEARLLRAAILSLAKQIQPRSSGNRGSVAIKTHSPPPIHAAVPPAAALSIEVTGGYARAAPRSLQGGAVDSPNVLIARAITRFHGGQLDVAANANGTAFEINLPGLEPAAHDRAPATVPTPHDPDKLLKSLSKTAVEGPRPQADDEQHPSPAAAPSSNGKKRILVADDEENFRSFIAWTLRQRGYEVVLASNGQEAFDRFQEGPASYCLVILDAYMPLMGGLEAYLRMHVLRPDLPVLFASGFFRGPSIEALVEGCPGPAAVLMKPFGADDLIKSVSTALSPGSGDDGEFEPADSNQEEN